MTEHKPARIALCISGQPRSFEEAYPYIKKNIIDQHAHIDVFLHCWYNPSETGQRFTHTSETVREEGINLIPARVPERLQELYAPKAMRIEPQEDFTQQIRDEYRRSKDKTNPFATFSMWTSIQRCNNLKRTYEEAHGFIYDLVIKCRYDVCLTVPLQLLVQDEAALHTSYATENMVEDIIFCAPSIVMDTVCNLPNELDIHFHTLNRWNNEMFLAQQCAVHTIPVVQHPEWRNFTLIRGQRTFLDTLWYVIRRLRTKLHI